LWLGHYKVIFLVVCIKLMIKSQIHTYTIYGLYVFIYIQYTFLGVQGDTQIQEIMSLYSE